MRRGRVILAGGVVLSALGIVSMHYSTSNLDSFPSAQVLQSQVAAEKVSIQTLDAKIVAYWTVITDAKAAYNVPIPASPEAYLQEPSLAESGFEGAVNSELRNALEARTQSVERLAALVPVLQQKEDEGKTRGDLSGDGFLAVLLGFSVGLYGFVKTRGENRDEKDRLKMGHGRASSAR